jgi:glycerate 2-kinase
MARAARTALGAALGPCLAVGPEDAGHPLPDRRGLRAAEAAETMSARLGRDDLLLVLLSGGASALLPAPAPGLRLEDKTRTTRLLMHAGADIADLNTVRKHLSRLKGGRLAHLASPARVVCLALSDVVGDDLSVIGSGPTVPDPTTYADACAVVERHGLRRRVPTRAWRHLDLGRRGRRDETPKPGDPLFRRVQTEVIGGGRTALDAAAREARRLGWPPQILTSRLQGEAREVGRVLAAVLRERAGDGRGGCLLAAGETTVTVRGRGVGGRNLELAVAAAAALDGVRDVLVAAFATDGRDGASDAAGGLVTGRTVARARALDLAPIPTFLAENDAEAFLAPLGDLIVTGPTGTNVADLVVMLAGPGRAQRGL